MLQFIEQIEHYSLKVKNFLSKDYNIDGEISTKLNNSFKLLYLINHLKIKICYLKYTSVSSPILKDHDDYIHSKKDVGQSSLNYYFTSYGKGCKASLVVELTKSTNNKVNESLISIFRRNEHEDSIDHPQKNKIDMLIGKESVIRSK